MKITKRILFVFLISIFSTTIFAGEVFKVAVINSFPFGYKDSQGKLTGTHWNYWQEISKASGIEMELTLTPKKRILKNAKEGKIDGFIMFHSKSRDYYIKGVSTIRPIKVVALSRKGLKINSYDDLYQHKAIGVFRGTKVTKKFDSDSGLMKSEKNSYDTMVKMLGAKRLDSIIGNSIVLSSLVNEFGLKNEVQFPPLVLSEKAQWLQIPMKSTYISEVANFKKIIQKLKSDGTFDKILTNHVGEGWQKF
jgi:ABC-type amino acid transport substrate-binding protein